MTSISPPNIKALKWQCRRGMLELDILLNRFLEKIENENLTLTEKEYQRFNDFLALSDPEIYTYITQPDTVPADYQELIHALKQ